MCRRGFSPSLHRVHKFSCVLDGGALSLTTSKGMNIVSEKDILIQVIGEGLSDRRQKAKLNLVEAAKMENELLLEFYMGQLKKIDSIYDKLETALETNTGIQLIEAVQEEVQLLN